MSKNNRKSPGSLAQAAAVLGLALAAVSAMPAAADDATPKAPETGNAESTQSAEPATEAEDKSKALMQKLEAANPCAVKKRKKRKSPCAVGG